MVCLGLTGGGLRIMWIINSLLHRAVCCFTISSPVPPEHDHDSFGHKSRSELMLVLFFLKLNHLVRPQADTVISQGQYEGR